MHRVKNGPDGTAGTFLEELVVPGEGLTRLHHPLTWPAESSVLWEIERCDIRGSQHHLGCNSFRVENSKIR